MLLSLALQAGGASFKQHFEEEKNRRKQDNTCFGPTLCLFRVASIFSCMVLLFSIVFSNALKVGGAGPFGPKGSFLDEARRSRLRERLLSSARCPTPPPLFSLDSCLVYGDEPKGGSTPDVELFELVREYANEAFPGTARLDVEVLEFVRE